MSGGSIAGVLLGAILLLAGSAAPVEAAPARYAQADQSGARSVQISRDRAAAIAAARTGGRVLDVSLRGGSRPRYRVRVLISEERVRTITIDARTGEILD